MDLSAVKTRMNDSEDQKSPDGEGKDGEVEGNNLSNRSSGHMQINSTRRLRYRLRGRKVTVCSRSAMR